MTEQVGAAVGEGGQGVAQARQAVEAAEQGVQYARREFLRRFGFGAAAALAAGAAAGPGTAAAAGPAGSPYASAWQFAPGLLYMNLGTTGATPQQVVTAAAADAADLAANPTAYFFGQQGWRNAIAPGFGCDPYELVMSFNTTDGLHRIVMGLEWKKNDEVITTNMEESAGISAYSLLADRYGVGIKKVAIPTNDQWSDAEIMRRFEALRTPRTKAILFSSPIYLTGTRLPEKALCAWAASHGILSIVDGAHLPGMVALDLHDMGCDFFSGAGHKWQCGPGQTGFLYLRNGQTPAPYVRQAPVSDFGFLVPGLPTVDVPVPGYANTGPLPRYWPTNTLLYGAENGVSILKDGQRRPDDNVAALLQLVGNGSRPSQRALFDCCRLWDGWGRAAIEAYLVSLAWYLRAKLAAIWGPRSLSFPLAAGSNAGQVGLTSFNPFSPGFDYNADLTPAQATAQAQAAAQALSDLRSGFGIVARTTTVPHTLRSDPTRTAVLGSTASTPLRISTHLFHSTADVDRLVDALLSVVPHP